MTLPFDRILVADAETRWSSKPTDWCPDAYTLRKLTTEEYIRSPLFKAFGFCFKWYGEEGAAVWIPHWKLKEYLAGIDWSRTAICCHNAQFDAAILSWHYGVNPAFIFDTLSMARALRGLEVGNSAFKLAQDFGLPPKGDALVSSDGLYELPLEVEVGLADYCRHDTWLAEQFLERMLPGYPAKELRLIDMTIRMFTQPQLMLDAELLQGAIDEDEQLRAALLGKIGVSESALASSEQFSEALRALGVEVPLKKSKTTGEMTYAFAKNDAHFQALINSDNEDVALLCEARLKVKSTQERTRAQRFLDISTRGLLPVPVNYAHTRTMRWGAAKGSNINMQNLKRGGKLRKSVIAPPGHQCVAGDLSQIEPRVLAYLSDYEELLGIFASGKDAYAQFGAGMFGIPGLNKEEHPDLRQSAKSALLGCFAADTKVLTNSGWKPIVQVSSPDKLWDGESWVSHTGLVSQGIKTTFLFQGVRATDYHEILTEHGWRAWKEVRTKTSLFQSARRLANLPSSIGDAHSYTKKTARRFTPTFAALVAGKVLSYGQTSHEGAPLDATPARKSKLQKLAKAIFSTLTSLRTLNTENAFLIGYPPSTPDAKTQAPAPTPITEGAAYAFGKAGAKIEQRFFGISSLYPAGTSPSFNLTASTTNGDTNPATFGFVRAVKTWLTNAKLKLETLKRSNERMKNFGVNLPTYDISNAGPRNRFTILTDDGPIIVHNCGYRLGWASFATQLLTGFLGAPPVRYDKKFMKQLGIGRAEVVDFLSARGHEERVARMMEIPHTCTDEELLIHCVCAKEIIDRYRATSQPIVDFWKFLDTMIATVIAVPGAEPFTYKCLTFKPGAIVLPNGLPILYEGIKVKLDEKNRPQYTYWNGKMDKPLHSGIVAENVTSGTARCVIADGMLRVQKRYPIALTVHDELVTVVADAEVEEAKAWIKEQMIKDCSYMRGLPLNAEVGAARRYGEAK